MTKVMVFGTFDLLHKGHMNFLNQAKEYGDLIIVLGTDENIKRIKGKSPVNPLETRKRQLQEKGIADQVIAGYQKDFFRIIEEKMPHIICLGYDQNTFGIEEELNKRNWNIRIVKLKPYKENKYKSSLLRQSLS